MSAGGLPPDPWQRDVLESIDSRVLMLTSRQAGKSSVAGALAIKTAVLGPGSLVLLLSPSERQSGELAQKAFGYFDALGGLAPGVRKRTELQLHLNTGSRVIALPGKEATIRGYSGAALLLIDEASRVPDPLYYSVRPMLAVSGGRLVAMSTPFGKRGRSSGRSSRRSRSRPCTATRRRWITSASREVPCERHLWAGPGQEARLCRTGCFTRQVP
jgi:hypothetical protein